MGDIPEYSEDYRNDLQLTDEYNNLNNQVQTALSDYYSGTNGFIGQTSDDFFNFTKSHNVCGPGYYVRSPSWREQNPNDGTLSWGCEPCPDGTPFTEQDEYDAVDDPKPSMNSLNRMCSNDLLEWFPSQYSLNINSEEITPTIDWQSIATVTDGTVNVTNTDLYRKWYEDRLSTGDINMFALQSGYEDRVDEFKQEVTANRGSTVPCLDDPSDIDGGSITVPDGFSCSPSDLGYDTFGPDNIIMEEVEEWRNSRFDTAQTITEGTLPMMGQILVTPNVNFEICINNILNENNLYNDNILMTELSNMQSVTEIQQRHIDFIKGKLNLLLTDSNQNSLMNCIENNIYIDTSICDAGLTEQMTYILQILMSVIGVRFNMGEIGRTDNDKREALMNIIDNLGEMIPKTLNRIIEMSETLEQSCPNGVTNKTRVIRDLYNRVFGQRVTTVSLDFGISDLISNATSEEFNRSTIIAALVIAFLRFI